MKKLQDIDVIETLERLTTTIKNLGILAGGILASVADWVLGAISLSVIFADFPTGSLPPYMSPIVLGFVWSMALWGVQLMLWQLIITGKLQEANRSIESPIIRYSMWATVLILKFGDDIIDLSSIYWITQHNNFAEIMPGWMYVILVGAVYLVSWILVGFAEVFMSVALQVLKKPSHRPTDAVTRPTFISDDVKSRLPKRKPFYNA